MNHTKQATLFLQALEERQPFKNIWKAKCFLAQSEHCLNLQRHEVCRHVNHCLSESFHSYLKMFIEERSGWVVKVAYCKSTGREFEFTLAPLETCVRALNKFSFKSAFFSSPSRISKYQLNWGSYRKVNDHRTSFPA